MFMETSAMTGENVEEAFMKCARSVLSKIESGECSATSVSYGACVDVGGGEECMRVTRGGVCVCVCVCVCTCAHVTYVRL